MVSKILERLALTRLRRHLHGSPNFSRLQSAYRDGHSTETALLHVLNSVYAASDNRRTTVLIGLESASFDTISHDILIERREAQFAVCDSALSWFRSYLLGRQQFVKLGQHSSNIMPCDSGVPQGSVLGPLLFTAYVAPVSELIDSFGVSHQHFADDDDLHLLVAMEADDHTSALERLTGSDAVRRWFLRNHLQLNAEKSEVMTLGTAAKLSSVAAVTTVDVVGSFFTCQARDEVARCYHRQPLTLRQARRCRRQGV